MNAMSDPRTLSLAHVCLACLILTGCGTVHVTLPERSATEQYLLSTAVDRALRRQTALDRLRDRRVFVDTSYIQAYDREYVMLALRGAVLRGGGRLTDDRYDADVIVEVASGALSIDHAAWLLGIPALTIPIPLVGPVQTPELALLKTERQKGKAKINLLAYSAETREPVIGGSIALGSADYNSWWFLFLGPFNFTDLPPWPKESRQR